MPWDSAGPIFCRSKKEKICKGPKKAHFKGFFRYFVKVCKYKSPRPRANWSLGPWDLFGPIFGRSKKKICKGPKKGQFLGVFLLLGEALKIQKPKTPRELIAGPMGLVWTYSSRFRKHKICKGPKKAHFQTFFRYLVKVLKYKSLRPRGNWSLGPWDSFGPIFRGSKNIKFVKAQKGPFSNVFSLLGQGVKIQKPKTPRELIVGPMGFVWTYFSQF